MKGEGCLHLWKDIFQDNETNLLLASHISASFYFFRDCTQTADTKPAYLNLSQRVDRQIDDYLYNIVFNPKVCNLNQHRERLRKRILE